MFNRGKVKTSPSMPKSKPQIKDSTQEWESLEEDELSNSALENCQVSELTQEDDQVTDSTSEDDGVSGFTNEDYEDVEQLRNTGFTDLDIVTDHLVVPSSKYLLEDDVDVNVNYSNPVASSTQIFPKRLSAENTSRYENKDPVKVLTFELPNPPDFDYETELVPENFNPLASSTHIFPKTPNVGNKSHYECIEHVEELAFELPKPPDLAENTELVSLTSCRNIDSSRDDLLSIDPASLPPEISFRSDAQESFPSVSGYPPASTKTKSKLKVTVQSKGGLRVQTSNKNCPSSSHGDDFNTEENIQEEVGARTISFRDTLKNSKKRLASVQRIVKSKRTNPILDDTRTLREISNQPKSKLLVTRKVVHRNEPDTTCCLASTRISRPLKVMKPLYRSDLTLDDLRNMKI